VKMTVQFLNKYLKYKCKKTFSTPWKMLAPACKII